jgi:tRNA-modifying protein YgfZ
MLSPAPMPFKDNREAASAPRLSGFSLLDVSGPDAASFLQAQTMNDVRSLGTRRWHWNGWLNAKGRLIALFALLKVSEEEFIAVLPDFPADELQPLLQRFVFRSKVRLKPLIELVPAAALGCGDPGLPHDEALGLEGYGLQLDFSGEGPRRCLLLLPETSAVLAPADPNCDGQWLSADLAHGLPRLGPSQREAWTPQMLSLERLNAFSLKKGCYPGQEIVARTHYLGQARRGLTRLHGIGLQVGATIKDQQGVAFGTVISVAADSTEGLAVIQSDKRASAALIDEQVVAMPDFLEGLKRPL